MQNRKLNIVVIGASGAIGAEFVEQYAKKYDAHIFAFSRSETTFANTNISSHFIDIDDEESIKSAAELASRDQSIDIVIVATGMLHNDRFKPEKSLKELTKEKFHEIFNVNAVAPAIIIKHFLPKLTKDEQSIFAALSARVSSISDNHLGGWYAYRTAKAALNMILKTASIEINRSNKKAVIVGLHPGTVDSKLSKPFQSFVKPGKLFTAEFAVSNLIKVLDNVSDKDNGNLYDFNGLKIDF